MTLAGEPDVISAAFFEGMRYGELRVQYCRDCGTCQLGRIYCQNCSGKDMDWRAASGMAHLYSFVTMHIAYHPAFADSVPYSVALAELSEGPRLFARIRHDGAMPLHVGAPGRIDIMETEPGIFVPVFVPKAGHSNR